MVDIGVIVAALAVIAVVAVLVVTAVPGFGELRRFLRGQY
jgi:hypothetical protein